MKKASESNTKSFEEELDLPEIKRRLRQLQEDKTVSTEISDLFAQVDEINDLLREFNPYHESINNYQKIISTINSIDAKDNEDDKNSEWEKKKEEWTEIYERYMEKSHRRPKDETVLLNNLFAELHKKEPTIPPEQPGPRNTQGNILPRISYSVPNEYKNKPLFDDDFWNKINIKTEQRSEI